MEYYENPDPEYDNYEYDDDGEERDTTGSGDYGSYYDYEYDVDGADYEEEYGYGNQVGSQTNLFESRLEICSFCPD